MKTKLIFVAGLSCFTPAQAFAAPKPLTTPDWTVQAAFNLSVPRAAHQATLLSEALVLVTGGCSGSGCSPVERSAELFHTSTGRTEITPPMREARVAHMAALLKDGRVLVAGGWTGNQTTASAEFFDPGTRTFTPAAAMLSARMDATATPLTDGSILLTGGASAVNNALSQAEVFDLNKGRFVATGPMHQARAHHAAARLPDGRVLVIGGLHKRQLATATAELYNPATNTFSQTGAMRHARCKHGAVPLQDGRVMVIGGSRNCEEQHRIAQTEIYDPDTGRFSEGPSLLNPRYKIVTATTVLPSGDVVVVGDAKDVEIWTPGAAAFVKAVGSIGNRLAFSTATPLSGGKVLVLGGYDNHIRPTAQSWLVYRKNQADTSD
ncbi:kelch repeat-containing protein [Rheinheimera sp. 4Y26]|uniref:Kelch repeat-containing protein n=1 Tax=Rheinheimera sp. 4Y26 TaxID=2977811 RepID=UPI0021B0F961|nr:kelch repeat-containing protein [Rheinheimera sp. 4Y26]MCT6701202.1 hypothetical protein [Rheinheimera sp. 4Y26]